MAENDFLSSVDIFSSLTPAEIEQLAAYLTPIEKNENDIIFRKKDPAHKFYIIKEGSVKITLPTSDGDDILISVFHKGDVFGELTIFEKIPRTANAIAIDHVQLLEMSHKDLIGFLKQHPDVSINMLGMLSKRIRKTNDMMSTQITRNVNDELEQELTFGERIADRFAEIIGSWAFIIWFCVGLVVWILLNIYAIIFKPVDPYPFILLNLILSCLAAIQAPVIMMSQGRQSKKDHIAADLDYNINLKAELQVQEIRANIEKIQKQGQRELKELRHNHHEIEKHLLQIEEKLNQHQNQNQNQNQKNNR